MKRHIYIAITFLMFSEGSKALNLELIFLEVLQGVKMVFKQVFSLLDHLLKK